MLRDPGGTLSLLILSHQHWQVITQGIPGNRAPPGENLRLGNNLFGEEFPSPHIVFKEEVGLCNKDVIYIPYRPIYLMNTGTKILSRMIANKI